jgi:hypothetical protein
MINVGEIIKIKGMKRVCGQVSKVEHPDTGCYNITMKAAYKPSPKSRLHNKNPFRKLKLNIVK